MCAELPASGDADVNDHVRELRQYRNVLYNLGDRITEAWSLFELATAKGINLHIAIDFSEIYDYFILPPAGEGKDSGELMRLMISLCYLFEGKTLFGSKRRPLVLLPPYMAEMRDTLASIVANEAWDTISTILSPRWSAAEKTLERKLKDLASPSSNLDELSPKEVAEIVKDQFPSLFLHILRRAYLVNRIKDGLHRFDGLHMGRDILYFHEYEVLRENADKLGITEDELNESSDKFFSPIDKKRVHKRQLQSRRDAHACLYVERINQVLPETETLILISHSNDLLESVGSLLRVPVEKISDIPNLEKLRCAFRARYEGTSSEAEPEDQSGDSSLPALVPTETVFAFLMCAAYSGDQLDVGKTREAFQTLYNLTSELRKNLQIVDAQATVKQKPSDQDTAQAISALSERHNETIALIRQYENFVSAVGAIPMWDRYVEQARKALDAESEWFARQVTTLVDALKRGDIRNELLDRAAEALDDLWLQQTLEKCFLELMRQAEHGSQQIEGFLKGHRLLLSDASLKEAFSTFSDSLLAASKRPPGGKKPSNTRTAFLGLWRTIVEKADNPEAFLISGFLSLHLGMFKNARRYLEKARKSTEARSVTDEVRYQIEFFLAIAYRVNSRTCEGNKALEYLKKAREILEGFPDMRKKSASWQKEKAVVEFLTWQETGDATHFLEGIRLSMAGLGGAGKNPEIRAYLLSNLSLSSCLAAEMTGEEGFLEIADKYLSKLEAEIPDETLWEADFLDNKGELLICKVLLSQATERRSKLIDEAVEYIKKAHEKAMHSGLFADRVKYVEKIRDTGIDSMWVGIHDMEGKTYHKIFFERRMGNIIAHATEIVPFRTSEEAEKAGYNSCKKCTKFTLLDCERVQLKEMFGITQRH